MKLEKYSFGVGDRFGHQGKAQLDALIKAKQKGLDVVPVWNKSHREHTIIGTHPRDVRTEADAAVKAMNWTAVTMLTPIILISATSKALSSTVTSLRWTLQKRSAGHAMPIAWIHLSSFAVALLAGFLSIILTVSL